MDFDDFEDIVSKFNEQDKEKNNIDKQQEISNNSSNKNIDIFNDLKLLQDEVFKKNDLDDNKTKINKSGKNKEYEKHLYSGHRQRARERFLLNPEEVSDYDLLELLLFLIIPRADTKPIAKKLIDRFKTIKNVFNANINELNDIGVNGQSLKYLSTLINVSQKRILQQQLKTIKINNMDKLVEYCKSSVSHLNYEEFHILFIDAQLYLICDKKISNGTNSDTIFNIKDILQQCIAVEATNVILYHNHPSGSLKPSKEDIETTNKINNLLQNINIEIIDHIIIGNENYYSFKQNDLI